MLSFACYHVGKRPSSISDLFYLPPSDQQQPLMEGDLIGSYSELGSDEAVLLEQQYESDDAVLSDLSSIKTYSQDDYGEEELHGYGSNPSSKDSNPKTLPNISRPPEAPETTLKLISEGQRVFLPLALTSDVKLNWTQRFVQISSSLRQNQPFHAVARDLIKLAALEREFLQTATLYARVIIDEKFLPMDQKTVKPSNLGGVAGGLKYYQEGILFKFSLDTVGLYGGDINAMKSAGHELKCLGAVFKRLNNKYNVPMMSVIDYKGFRVIAISMLPVGHQTLVYGSNNGGRDFHTNDSDVNDEMADLGRSMNLQNHRVRADGFCTRLPADIGTWNSVALKRTNRAPEVHKGLDDRYYIVDVARLWPPEPPTTLREELVTTCDTTLCSDGFSAFLGKDTSARSYSANIRVAFTRYTVVTIPAIARDLDLLSPNELGFDIIAYLHQRGVNMRHMGVLWQNLPEQSEWRKVVLTEIVARAAKSVLRALMRRSLERFGGNAKKPLNSLICNYFNLLLGSSDDSELYWAVELKHTVESSFFYIAKDENKLKDVGLRTEVDQEKLLQKLSRMAGITLKKSFWRGLSTQLMLNRGNLVQDDDIESIEPVVKRSSISRFAEPIEMIERLDCGVKNVEEADVGYKVALQKLLESPSIGHGSSFITFRYVCRILAQQPNWDYKTIFPYLLKLTNDIWKILETSPMDYKLNLKQFLRDFSGLYFRFILPFYNRNYRSPSADYIELVEQLVHPYFLGITLTNDRELLADRPVLSESIFDDIASLKFAKYCNLSLYQRLFSKLTNLRRLNLDDYTTRNDVLVNLVRPLTTLECLEAGLRASTQGDNEALLEPLKNLHTLYNISFKIAPHKMASLTARELIKLSLDFMEFHNEDNAWYKDFCAWMRTKQGVKTLRLDRVILNDNIVPLLASAIHQVEELEFGQFCTVQPIDCLLSLPHLTKFVMERNSFKQTTITSTGPSFKLQKLSILHTSCAPDIFIGILRRCPDLVELRAMYSSFDDDCCEALLACPKLEVLNLVNTKITGAGLAHVGLLANIKKLNVHDTDVDDEGIMHLTPVLPQLTALTCSKCRAISDRAARHILTHGRMLQKLKVSRGAITDEAFAVDVHAAAESLRHLAIEETHLTDAAIRLIIRHYSNLEVLKLPRSISIETLKSLYRLQNLNFVQWYRNKFDWATDPYRAGIAAWSLMLNKAGDNKCVVLQLVNTQVDAASTVIVGYAGGTYLYLDTLRITAKNLLRFVQYNSM